LIKSHSSEADARASFGVLDCQLGEYADLPADINGLHDFCCQQEENWIDIDGKFIWVKGEAVCSFGKHEGRLLKEMASAEPGYLQWIIKNDFSPEVKEMLVKALKGEFPVSPH
jgi:DNA polymerase-3 subunit epsilon